MDKPELYKDFPYTELKSHSSNAKLRIYILSYENRNEDWYENFIYLNINGMTVKITDCAIEAGELTTFFNDLKLMQAGKVKDVESNFVEPTIDLAFSYSKEDNIFHVRGGIINGFRQNNSKAYLQFEFDVSVEEFNVFVGGLEQLIMKYPSRSK
jgi:hypothetical protein